MKRILNIIHALVQLIILPLLILNPLAYFIEMSGYKGVIYLGNMFAGMTTLGIIAIGLLVCGILMSVVSAIRNTSEKDSVLHSIVPILTFIFMWVFVAWLGPYNAVGCYVEPAGSEFHMLPIWKYIQIIMLASIVLGFVKRAVVPKQKNGTTAVSSADELKKYKELLDSGVISKEEFDAKKKQLLGL